MSQSAHMAFMSVSVTAITGIRIATGTITTSPITDTGAIITARIANIITGRIIIQATDITTKNGVIGHTGNIVGMCGATIAITANIAVITGPITAIGKPVCSR